MIVVIKSDFKTSGKAALIWQHRHVPFLLPVVGWVECRPFSLFLQKPSLHPFGCAFSIGNHFRIKEINFEKE
jgi:hypothetical protein